MAFNKILTILTTFVAINSSMSEAMDKNQYSNHYIGNQNSIRNMRNIYNQFESRNNLRNISKEELVNIINQQESKIRELENLLERANTTIETQSNTINNLSNVLNNSTINMQQMSQIHNRKYYNTISNFDNDFYEDYNNPLMRTAFNFNPKNRFLNNIPNNQNKINKFMPNKKMNINISDSDDALNINNENKYKTQIKVNRFNKMSNKSDNNEDTKLSNKLFVSNNNSKNINLNLSNIIEDKEYNRLDLINNNNNEKINLNIKNNIENNEINSEEDIFKIE